MKFSHTLGTHLTPEWRNQYIQYEYLKTMLLEAIENAPHGSSKVVSTYNNAFSERFLYRCERELSKINNFFAEKLAEAVRKHEALVQALRTTMEIAEYQNTRSSLAYVTHTLYKRKLNEFKFSFSELYLNLVLLQNYQSLNHTGFRKILKKHDKLLNLNTGLRWFEDKVNSSAFVTNRHIMKLIKDIEDTYTNFLEGGDRARAMKRLRVPPLHEVQHPWTSFRMGLYLGAFVVMVIVITISLQQMEGGRNFDAAVRLYRGPFVLTIYLFLIGFNIFGWRKFGVNHILIFEIDPRNYLTAPHIIEMAAALGLLWALSILGFIYYRHLGMPPYIFPLLLLLMKTLFLLNPFHILHSSSRFWLIKLTCRCMGAPFFAVGFADFWFGDQLNSLVGCLGDYRYMVCFYMTNTSWTDAKDPYTCMDREFLVTPLVTCFPAWIRFAQSLRRYYDTGQTYPFLVNAGKYATSFFVVAFATLMSYHKDKYSDNYSNPYVWAYLISHSIQTVYCLLWDYLRDMMIMHKWSGENIFLRDHILYPPAMYYFAIVENFFIRFYWVPSFILRQLKWTTSFTLSSVGIGLEVFRRYVWNYFRLENEHLFNTGQFRAVRDISVSPIEMPNLDFDYDSSVPTTANPSVNIL